MQTRSTRVQGQDFIPINRSRVHKVKCKSFFGIVSNLLSIIVTS